MMIVPKHAIHELMVQIVNTTHAIIDQDGQRISHSTIDDRRLRMAALTAINTALGEVVWPEDQRIQRPKPQQAPGPFSD